MQITAGIVLGGIQEDIASYGDANLKEWLARMHLITIGNHDAKDENREKIVPDLIQMEGSSLHYEVPGIAMTFME